MKRHHGYYPDGKLKKKISTSRDYDYRDTTELGTHRVEGEFMCDWCEETGTGLARILELQGRRKAVHIDCVYDESLYNLD